MAKTWFPAWYGSNHFCAHTGPADVSGNCVHVIERPKILLLGYNHDTKVVVSWLWGSTWMLCNTAHVLCWNVAVNLQEELWTLFQSRVDCKNPYVKMINVRGWAAWPGLPTYSILLSGAVAALIKKAIIISQWLAGPSALVRNLYIAHGYDPSTIPTARSSLLSWFLSEMPLSDANGNSERRTEHRVHLMPGPLSRSRQSAPGLQYIWCEVSFSQTHLNSDWGKAEVWFQTLFCYLCLLKIQHLPTLLLCLYSVLFILASAYSSL